MKQPTRQHWNDDALTQPRTTAAARLELAATCRLLARECHPPIGGARFAARDPECPDTYLANPIGPLLEETRPSRLISLDRHGIHRDTQDPAPDSGALAIVLAALQAKPDAAAAALLSSTDGCVIASLEVGLLPITQTAFMFHGAVEIFDFDPAANEDTLRQDVAAAIGNASALLVRGRGLLVCGDTLAQTWKLLFFLDKCCRSQVAAMAAANATGTPLTVPSDEVVAHAVAQSRSFIEHPRYVADWPSFLDQLDQEDPSWRE